MTTQARNKAKRKGIAEQLRIASWNVRGLVNKEREVEIELKRQNIDIAILPETKKKLKGSKDLEDYILLYSGVPMEKRAASGIAIMLHNKFRRKIDSYNWISDRIINVRIQIPRGYLTIIGLYAPEEGKKEESKSFYKELQKHLNTINKNDYIIIGGDLNARVGNDSIDDVLGNNGEERKNENGKMLLNFSIMNKFRITNSFFRHRDIHKYTWVARGMRSIIDYILVNQKLVPEVQDTRVYRGPNINSDHYMLLSRINLLTRWAKKKTTTQENQEYFKIHLLQDESTRRLYCTRLRQKLDQRAISLDVEMEWNNLEEVIYKTALEALGTRKKRKKNKGLSIWNDEIAKLIQQKKLAYLRWLSTKLDNDKIEYKKLCAIVKREIRKIQNESWNTYLSNIEHKVYGNSSTAYRAIKHLNRDEKDMANINNIPDQVWLEFYKNLWTTSVKEMNENNKNNNKDLMEVDLITYEELKTTLASFKNKKSPGTDNINIELFKYAPDEVMIRFLDILNICWRTYRIPNSWKEALICPVFKKGNRKECNNYRGISLLNTAYKIYAKIITRRLNTISEVLINGVQHGFRRGRSCSDCVFILKQIIQKRREYNLETHILFVDFVKAFDRVSRGKLWEIMKERGYPLHIVKTIEEMYKNTKICIKKHGNEEVINLGVRQGCPLSPTLFNIYIDAAVLEWQEQLSRSFTIGNVVLNTILFADDQVILSTSEEELQRATYKLQQIFRNYNLEISTQKSKVMAFEGKYPIRSKIVLANEIIEQVNGFKYLGCWISYEQERDIEYKLNQFRHICGTIQRTLRNKTRKDTIIKFYKVLAVPLLLYGSENWVLNRSVKRKIETSEMQFLRRISGYTLQDHIYNMQIREELNVYKLEDKINNMKWQWYQHINRMDNNRITKQAFLYKPNGRRSIGRPRMRWEDVFASEQAL